MTDELETLKQDFLETLYRYAPITAFSLIERILADWGCRRKKVEGNRIIEHERDTVYRFMRQLQAMVDENPDPLLIVLPGTEELGPKFESSAKYWADQWIRFPYDEALQAFTEAVFEWMQKADMRSVVDEKSPNQFVYFLRQLWIMNA